MRDTWYHERIQVDPNDWLYLTSLIVLLCQWFLYTPVGKYEPYLRHTSTLSWSKSYTLPPVVWQNQGEARYTYLHRLHTCWYKRFSVRDWVILEYIRILCQFLAWIFFVSHSLSSEWFDTQYFRQKMPLDLGIEIGRYSWRYYVRMR